MRQISGAIVITGASSGIGAALAELYADAGQPLLLIARRADALQALATRLMARGAVVRTASVDVRDAPGLDAVAGEFVQAFGPVGLLIANAGISHGTLSGAPEDRAVFADIFQTNVLGVVWTCTAFLPHLAAGAQVVGIASVAGFRGLPGAAAYSASKAAVMRYLESLRLELRPRGIGVTCIAPGYIATPMTEGNAYPMPWCLPADRAAQRMGRAIAQRRRRYILPWQMAVVAWWLQHLPGPVYDWLLFRARGKARRDDPGLKG